MDDEDVWARVEVKRRQADFGSACVQDLGWYLEGRSAVPASTIPQVCRWLRGCRYVGDSDLFQRGDFWQHPRTFEQIRRGDCEDHALWAMKKLSELGYAAELVVGDCKDGKYGIDGYHAWVVFDAGEGKVILEAVAKNRDRMLLPFNVFRDSYIPHFSFDSTLRIYMYAGFVQSRANPRRHSNRLVPTI